MKRKKVLLLQPIHESGIRILEPHFEVRVAPDPSLETAAREIVDASGVIVRTSSLPKEVMEKAHRLEVIARHGVGVDNVDVAYATSRGIPVAYTPHANATSVAEHVIALMLALAKRLLSYDAATRSGNFDIRNSYKAIDLEGKLLGVVGMGRIGRRLCQKCRNAFDMKVMAYDPYVSREEMGPFGAKPVAELDELLTQADFVSLHIPLTKETKGLIGKRELALMKRGAFLINASRGGIVDEAALLVALREGHLGGAALDVFEEEPPRKDSELFKLENIIVTPHSAALTQECVIRMATGAAEAVRDVLLGGKPRHVVNPEVYGRMV